MNICIVGGGFYGCYLAIKLKKNIPKAKFVFMKKIKIFFKNQRLIINIDFIQVFIIQGQIKLLEKLYQGQNSLKRNLKNIFIFLKKIFMQYTKIAK